MSPILPQFPARTQCELFIQQLDSSELGKRLMEKDCGRMFGILTCTDGTVFKAFSGQLLGSYTAEGFVPPCFDVEQTTALLDEYDAKIKSVDTADPKRAADAKKALSKECWALLCNYYRFHCWDGSTVTLSRINTNVPAGTGDCCAPRLLSYCYSLGKKPQSLCEFYYGSGSHAHLSFHNPCDERCKPILPAIIGLNILYLDHDIVVVHKPSGLLAIEGRTPNKQDCVASRVRNFLGSIQQPCVHRLDQATSGLMVLGLTDEAHRKLCLQFENREVYKEYQAFVLGKIIEKSGRIDLPMRLDTENRPHQIVDFTNGKRAVTNWENLGIKRTKYGYATRLLLKPETGRTHQLRLHCAQGLNHPIINDPLYGPSESVPNRLLLQATLLEFTHPITGERLRFEDSLDF